MRALFALALAAGLAACGSDKNTDEGGARALLAKVQQQKYRTWARAPGYEVRRKAASPHSDQVDIYINPVVADVLAKKLPGGTWPLGSIIVKDGFNGAGYDLTAVMEKRADGWYWAEYGGDGTPLFSGQPSTCTDCHESGADMVRAFGFP
jgi:hypothetical protein